MVAVVQGAGGVDRMVDLQDHPVIRVDWRARQILMTYWPPVRSFVLPRHSFVSPRTRACPSCKKPVEPTHDDWQCPLCGYRWINEK
jgi:hypothetical protein